MDATGEEVARNDSVESEGVEVSVAVEKEEQRAERSAPPTTFAQVNRAF